MAAEDCAAQPLVCPQDASGDEPSAGTPGGAWRADEQEGGAAAVREVGEQRPARRVAALAVTAVALAALGVWLFSDPQTRTRRGATRDAEPRLLESPPRAAHSGGGAGAGCDGPLCATESWGGWRNAQSRLGSVYQRMPWFTSTSTTTTTPTTTSTTTSTTTTTWCMEAAMGDACYQEVVEAMRAVQADPDGYDGLSEWSSFEEVQDYLYHQSFGAIGNQSGGPNATACWQSCRCQTAKVGSECYDEVVWTANVDFARDPDGYPTLPDNSSFEEFQMHLWRHGFNGTKRSECSRPCAGSWRADPSLFCWSVSRREGYEADIMRSQLSNGAGIFACDGFAVLSEESWTVGRGPGERIGEVSSVLFKGAWVGRSRDGTAGNAELFINAWDALMEKTFALRFDWVVKADPDAVIIADRLRDHVRPHTGQSAYIRNCNGFPQSSDYPMMYGSLEAISKEGLRTYRDNVGRCQSDFAAWWRTWGEDLWMGKCLLQLGVGPRDDFGIISDGVCRGDNNDCGNWWSAAFHPFKSTDAWMNCWGQATWKGAPKPFLPEL